MSLTYHEAFAKQLAAMNEQSQQAFALAQLHLIKVEEKLTELTTEVAQFKATFQP